MSNDFSKFYTFMAIVKEKSFSKASNILGISQPAVTLQMKKLEEALAATLVIRKKNGIILTREGEKFYKLCTQFESAMFRFKDEVSRIKSNKVPLVIATTQIIAETFISLLLDKISEVTGAELDIRIREQNELIGFLKDRRSDICIALEQSFDERLLVKKLFEYDVILVSNRPTTESVKPEELSKFKFIKDTTKGYIAEELQKYGVNYDNLQTAYLLEGSIMIKRAILNNNADEYVTFAPRFLVEDSIKDGKLFEIKINRFKIARNVYAVALKENEEMLNKFLQVKDKFGF